MTIVRKTFTLTQRDLELLKMIAEKCGYVSDSEAIRAIIRFYFEHAPCFRQQQ
jgi:metal-responsive CopG/Arc/MetJ family transcriptional regulator